MKKILPFIFSLFIPLSTLTAQNSLHFDGVNDLVTVPNATSLISGGNLSISCWVYPTKTGGPYGMVGFRNNVDADFYLLQLTATSMECRFRGSTGLNYDLVYNGFVLNQWQHFILTADNDTMRLYHDGIQVEKIPIAGTILNTTTELRIGNLPYSTWIFSHEGNVDEVSLWSKAVSAVEANCIYTNGVNPTATDVQLYFDFNQGIAGGTNSAVTSLTDRIGNINGTLTGFGLTGTTSNWVSGVAFPTLIKQTICLGESYTLGSQTFSKAGTYFDITTGSTGCDSVTSLQLTVNVEKVTQNDFYCDGSTYNFRSKILSAPGTYYDTLNTAVGCDTVYELKLVKRPVYTSNLNVTICNGESYFLGTQELTTEGAYSQTFSSAFGCDSTINVNLDVDTVNVGVVDNNGTLIASALQSENTYEWYDCNNKTIVTGETGKFFTYPVTTPPGAYAVIVTNNKSNCSDTSACFGRVVGVEETSLQAQLSLVPNPVQGLARLNFGKSYSSVAIQVMNSEGKTVKTVNVNNKRSVEIDVEGLAAGIYFVRINADSETAIMKLLKE